MDKGIFVTETKYEQHIRIRKKQFEKNMTDYYINPLHGHGLEIKTVVDHIRKRPGMYIGRCGDGSREYDGIYTLFMYALESVLENMPIEKIIYINSTNKNISIDCKMTECPDSFFPKSEKLQPFYSSGYMISAIAALSNEYILEISTNESSMVHRLVYKRGFINSDETIKTGSTKDTVSVRFTPDEFIFDKDFYFRDEFINEYIKRYSTVNPAIKFIYNGTEILSPHGMTDFIEWKFDNLLLPTIHVTGEGIDLAINAARNLNGNVRNQYTSFNNAWNGNYSPETKSFITSTVTALNNYFGLSLNIKNYYGLMLQPADEHNPKEFYMHKEKFPANLVGALWIKINDPIYIISQGRTLGSKWLDKAETITVEDFISKFIETELPKYLDANPDVMMRLKDILMRK